MMVYAVIDTNVLVSALLTHNKHAATVKVLELMLNGIIMPLFDKDIITEYEDDRVFYEVALNVEDSFLVTGNLKHYPSVPKVVTPSELIKLLTE
jgi:predicted nucleic acid-binding protein